MKIINIQDGNPNNLNTGYINFYKRRLVAEVIKEIQQYQQTPYNLTAVQQIQNYLLNSETMDEAESFKLSLQIEPREQ